MRAFLVVLLFCVPCLGQERRPATDALKACDTASQGQDVICDKVKEIKDDFEVFGKRIVKEYGNEKIAGAAVFAAKVAVDKKLTIVVSRDETLGSPSLNIAVDSIVFYLRWEIP